MFLTPALTLLSCFSSAISKIFNCVISIRTEMNIMLADDVTQGKQRKKQGAYSCGTPDLTLGCMEM